MDIQRFMLEMDQNAGAHSNYDGQQGDSSGKEVNVKETGTHWQYAYRLGGK